MLIEKIMPVNEFERYLVEGLISSQKDMEAIYGSPSLNMELSPYYFIIAKYYGDVSVNVSLGMVAMISMIERSLQTRELERLSK